MQPSWDKSITATSGMWYPLHEVAKTIEDWVFDNLKEQLYQCGQVKSVVTTDGTDKTVSLVMIDGGPKFSKTQEEIIYYSLDTGPAPAG